MVFLSRWPNSASIKPNSVCKCLSVHGETSPRDARESHRRKHPHGIDPSAYHTPASEPAVAWGFRSSDVCSAIPKRPLLHGMRISTTIRDGGHRKTIAGKMAAALRG